MTSAIQNFSCKSKSDCKYRIIKMIASKKNKKIEYLYIDNGFWFNAAVYLVSVNDIEKVYLEDKEIVFAITDSEIKEKSKRFRIDISLSDFELIKNDPSFYHWSGFDSVYGMMPVAIDHFQGSAKTRKGQVTKSPLRKDHWYIDDLEDYYLEGVDGFVAWLTDIMIDTSDWLIEGLVVETGKWRSKQQKLVPYSWVTFIEHESRRMDVHMKRTMLKDGHKFSSMSAVNREANENEKVFDYYGIDRTAS